MTLFGTSVRRVEDPRPLTTGGEFGGRSGPPGMRHRHLRHLDRRACAAARRRREARIAPGVLQVLVADDLDIGPCALVNDAYPDAMRRPLLARERVRYVGEPVVAIVAEERRQAPTRPTSWSSTPSRFPPVVGFDAGAGSTSDPVPRGRVEPGVGAPRRERTRRRRGGARRERGRGPGNVPEPAGGPVPAGDTSGCVAVGTRRSSHALGELSGRTPGPRDHRRPVRARSERRARDRARRGRQLRRQGASVDRGDCSCRSSPAPGRPARWLPDRRDDMVGLGHSAQPTPTRGARRRSRRHHPRAARTHRIATSARTR